MVSSVEGGQGMAFPRGKQAVMIWFSYLYLGGRMVIMDVSEERRSGIRTYVAALSEDPTVCFRAARAEEALKQLASHLRGAYEQSMLRVTFMEEDLARVGDADLGEALPPAHR